MSGTALVRRPTEGAAITAASRSARPAPSAGRLADLLTAARATNDRYGARLFDCLLDRALGGAR